MPRRQSFEISVIERDLGSTAVSNSFEATMVACGGAIEEIHDFEREFLRAADLYSRSQMSKGDRMLRSARQHARLARIYAGLAAYANKINHLATKAATSVKVKNTEAAREAIEEYRRLQSYLRINNPETDLDGWEAMMGKTLNDPTFKVYDRNTIAAREFEKSLLEVDDSLKRVARLTKDMDKVANRSQALNDKVDEEEMSNMGYVALALAGIATLILTAYLRPGEDQ